MTNDPQPLINGLTRSETDASASVAGVSASDSVCARGVWWTHKKATFTTPRQAAFAAWDAATERLADAQSCIASLTAQVESMRADKAKACHIALKKSTENERLTADLAEARAERDEIAVKRAREATRCDELIAKYGHVPSVFPDLKAAATAPRVPLTDEAINRLISASEVYQYHPGALLEFVREIELAHGISAIPGDDAKAVGGEWQS